MTVTELFVYMILLSFSSLARAQRLNDIAAACEYRSFIQQKAAKHTMAEIRLWSPDLRSA